MQRFQPQGKKQVCILSSLFMDAAGLSMEMLAAGVPAQSQTVLAR